MASQVTINEGALEGKICTAFDGCRYYSFEGIPYAKPPVGKLRFRDPKPVESWSGLRDATKPGNMCAQMNPFGKFQLEGSEDCLYLNVYTPCLPAEKLEKLPVLFFIHGGGGSIGHSHYYRPDYLIRHHVILVTVNYRLNVLGFLCLNIPEVPGNAALKDTIMALKWIKRNIKYFNGDEDNVIAIGESAGAGITTSYLVSKMADNLVHKIIAQSGVCISDLLIADTDPIVRATQICSYLGRDLSDPSEMYDYLQNTPLDDLLYAYISVEMNRLPIQVESFFLPVVEKKFDGVEHYADEYPIIAMRENRFKKIPILTSINSHEGALFLRRDENGDIIFERNFQHFIPRYIFKERRTLNAVKFADSLRDCYFSGKRIDNNTIKEYINMLSDHLVGRDILFLLELLSKFYKDIYLCRFAYEGNLNTRTMKSLGIKGASHGDLIQYIFYKSTKANKCNEKDLSIVDALTEAWCNFAKNGKPTWKSQNIEWLPYNKQDRLCLNIETEGMELKAFPEFDRIKFWFNLISEKSKI